ncbi:MAG: CRISPR-associated ring nuclease Csm6 [Xanthomonadaceae bacterium]|nr:CRISPR-associated ring nuclease Csm6 [Xanthomonadaceae bacterium]MDP2186037.1 CRISPR-associated ring nuclease Csm6 [Xanthomonadales bacterium]MDZ4117331.1 CRISPR-associated ring nuclease Csm6 [Xanthomonadaceae bacterium]
MEANQSPASPRRILLCVSGMSPQIVTETLYALACTQTPAWIPDEIHLISTREGANQAELALLSAEPGWFHKLRKDYALPPIRFDRSTIHFLHDGNDNPLDDIRTAETNALAADQIAEIVRNLTSDKNSSLHVSIAGGRKTMGYYAGYALSLFGREQDCLSHVLVDTLFESSPAFFYPTPYQRVIESRIEKRQIDCREAQVMLAEIPFVRLRHGLPKDLLGGRAHFARAVQAVQATLGPPELRIGIDPLRIEAGRKTVALQQADAAFLLWFAQRALQGKPGLARPSEDHPDPEYAAEYLAAYDRIKGRNNAIDRRYQHGMSMRDFDERKSRVNKALFNALGVNFGAYEITGRGRRPTRFALPLAPEQIRLIED